MKKIDEDLGGTTPLNVILKFPTQKSCPKIKMMNLKNGMKKKLTRIRQNIGLPGTKWIE